MSEAQSFTPGLTSNIAATTTTANQAYGIGGHHVKMYNSGLVIAFVNIAGTDNTVVATTASMPIPPGMERIFDKGLATNWAAITSTGTATVYATVGHGM